MRLRAFFLLVVLAALAVSASGCAQDRTLQVKLNQLARTRHVESDYQVAPPDELSIDVKGYPEYSRGMIVRPDGKITVPGVGDLYVQGLTLPEINDAVTEGLSKELTTAKVTVSLVTARSKAIYVLGEVRRPGTQPYYGDMNLIDALGAAGGLTLYAHSGKITITRESLEEPDIYQVDLKKLVEEGAAEQNVVLREGDIISVPPTAFAKADYAMDQLLFPFRSALSGLVTYGGVRNAFDDD